MFKKVSMFQPTLSQSWLMAIIILLGGTIFSYLITLPLLMFFPTSDFITKNLSYILMFTPVLVYIYYKGKNAYAKNELADIKAIDSPINNPNFGGINPIIFFILIFLASFSISMILDPIMSMEWMKTPEWFNKLMETMVGGDFIYTFISVSILAPLLEEFVCRGTIERGLLKHISPKWAIIWSAVIFATLHMNPWQAIPAFILGLFYGWVYYKTRSLWATIFLHFVNNTFSSVMILLFPDLKIDDSIRQLLPNSETYWLLFAMSIGIISITYFLINKYIPTNSNEKVIPS